MPYSDVLRLAEIREREQTEALARLGVDASHIYRLRLPDSKVSDYEPDLIENLLSIVPPNSQIIAPWRHDFHPDHEACGRAAEAMATQKQAALVSYFFWTWHRGVTETLAGRPLRYLSFGAAECNAKRDALSCHRSQLQRENGDPILPENLLKPAFRTFEVFLPA